MKTKIYNQNAEEVGEAELPDPIFALPSNPDLVYQAARVALANRRKTLAHAKDRGEVSGGGKKPWPQKGTGRSRHGSIRSPIWKGGGVTHGPKKTKNFSKKLPQKMNQKAIGTILSEKLKREEIIIFDEVSVSGPKTKGAAKLFEKFLKKNKKISRGLFLLPEKDEKLIRSVRNLSYLTVMPVKNVSILDLLNHRFLILTMRGLSLLEERFNFSKT